MRFIHYRFDSGRCKGRLYWTIRAGRFSLTHNPQYNFDWFAGRDPAAWFLYAGRLCLEHRLPISRQPEDPRHSAVDSPLAPNDGWRVEE